VRPEGPDSVVRSYYGTQAASAWLALASTAVQTQ
jgi:hypothetical protein